MIDLMQGAEDALFAAIAPLEQDQAMPAGTGIYRTVPQGTEPNFISIGMISSEADQDVSDQYEEITAEIHVVYRGMDRTNAMSMLHVVRRCIDGQELTAPDINFERPRYIRSDVGSAISDGVTFVGLIIFKFGAEPA